MFATAPAHKLPFTGAFLSLRTVLGLAAGRRQTCALHREEANREDMPRHVFDVLDLQSGEGCVTDWALVERAALLRDGWT